MPYIGPWGKFYHIPRCGGISMKYFLKSHFHDGGKQLEDKQHILPSLEDDLTDAWTVIRHPAEWLLSYFAYNEEHDYKWSERPKEVDEIFRFADGLFWPYWIRTITEIVPGAVGKVYDLYCLPEVKWYKLEEVDQIFSEPIGIKHVTEIKPVMTLDQWYMICEAERATLERFGYDDKPTGVVKWP